MLRLVFPLILLTTACSQIAVTDYNGSSIRIQSGTRQATREVYNEAERICRTQGLHAEYASTRGHGNAMQYTHLFMCLNSVAPNAGLPGGQAVRAGYFDSTRSM